MKEGYKNFEITIEQDYSPESPREWDNLGSMYCLHNRYELGDKHNFSASEIVQLSNDPDYISLPLFLYDHSGLTINTSGFSCPWDSGQVGIICVSLEKVRKEYSWKVITKNRREKIREHLRNEVSTYGQYLIGDVYGFMIKDQQGNDIDSFWGFYGADYCLAEARSIVDSHIESARKQRQNRLKTYIKNRVPIQNRKLETV